MVKSKGVEWRWFEGRVSTAGQEQGTPLADQRAVLEAEGCEAVYQDVYTGKAMSPPEFDRLRAEVRPGDTIVVTKLDRIARTKTEAYELVAGWVRDGIKVRVLNMGTIELDRAADTPYHARLRRVRAGHDSEQDAGRPSL